MICEVAVIDLPADPLVVGESYETVWPDGNPGPVVTLSSSGFVAVTGIIPFCTSTHCYVDQYGRCYGITGLCYRITRRHVEPKTPLERLKELAARGDGGEPIDSTELNEIIAEIESTEPPAG